MVRSADALFLIAVAGKIMQTHLKRPHSTSGFLLFQLFVGNFWYFLQDMADVIRPSDRWCPLPGTGIFFMLPNKEVAGYGG
jgi:hypothetical protein